MAARRSRHRSARAGKPRTASLRNSRAPRAAPAADRSLNPVGEWKRSRIVVRGKVVDHWLNDRKVLVYELGTAAVKAGIAGSKFSKYPDFGEKIRCHLMLTDHNAEAWFRAIKVRDL